jgi:hypothetical protein
MLQTVGPVGVGLYAASARSVVLSLDSTGTAKRTSASSQRRARRGRRGGATLSRGRREIALRLPLLPLPLAHAGLLAITMASFSTCSLPGGIVGPRQPRRSRGVPTERKDIHAGGCARIFILAKPQREWSFTKKIVEVWGVG